MICVSIGRTSHEAVLAEHRALAEQGAELVELRLDHLSSFPDLKRLLDDRPTPTIVTCRRQSDGGRWRFSEDERLSLLRSASDEGVEYVDLEKDIASQLPRSGKTRRIVSFHDFDATPVPLESIHAEMCGLDPDIVKLVTMAGSPSDIVRVLKLVDRSQVPVAGFCMGELGMASRILCGKYGAPFTYAASSSEHGVAPGQLSFGDMREVYRYDEIDSETQVFGVLGDPIAHSLSPLIHNAAFRHEGMNCVYVPLRVPADTFSKTLDDFEWLGFRGYSVTIPHKQAVLAKAVHCDEPVQDIGAANTLFRDGKGNWRATNTDYVAALESLQLGLQRVFDDRSLQGRRLLMLGAGGVARAIGMAVLREGATLTIANRTHSRAVALAEQLGCRQIPWDHRGAEQADVLVNCTSVGMHPHVDQTPYQDNWLREGMLVFETIYNPEATRLLEQAGERKCETVSGMEMFVRQAARQFELFADRPAPVELMRDTVRRGIAPSDGA
jgi:3-dehydroquinate dehydratase/shikimate dehydrogenase